MSVNKYERHVSRKVVPAWKSTG